MTGESLDGTCVMGTVSVFDPDGALVEVFHTSRNNALAKILARLGVSTTGAARLLGVSPSTVRGWIAGTRNGAPCEAPEPAVRLLELASEMPDVREWLTRRATLC